MCAVQRLQAQAKVAGVCLFFVLAGVAVAKEAPRPETNELRIVVGQLRKDNAALKAELQQRESVIRLLTENLAIARTESALFQKKWSEAQLRAQTLGISDVSSDTAHLQRQLVESVRSLYLANAECQRLSEELRRLVAATEGHGNVTAEVARAKAVLTATKQEVSKASATVSNAAKSGSIELARVLDMNPNLRMVVLNVGTLQGARVGMPFRITRGDRDIARVRVVEVRRKICGALIESVEKGLTVAAGDAAHVTTH